jgi:hypothetical protein
MLSFQRSATAAAGSGLVIAEDKCECPAASARYREIYLTVGTASAQQGEY